MHKSICEFIYKSEVNIYEKILSMILAGILCSTLFVGCTSSDPPAMYPIGYSFEIADNSLTVKESSFKEGYLEVTVDVNFTNISFADFSCLYVNRQVGDNGMVELNKDATNEVNGFDVLNSKNESTSNTDF